jgi:hypothetical protein
MGRGSGSGRTKDVPNGIKGQRRVCHPAALKSAPPTPALPELFRTTASTTTTVTTTTVAPCSPIEHPAFSGARLLLLRPARP